MIRVRGLISSIKSSLLVNRNAFPHKIQESWDRQFSGENPKMNYLQKLLQTNSIRPYFIQKDIKELEKEDIYFYMENKQIFHKIPQQTKQQLIKHPNTNTIFKFHLALELGSLKSQQVQTHLLHSFNSSIQQLSFKDLLFCLEVISTFKDGNREIDYETLQRKFTDESFDLSEPSLSGQKQHEPTLFIKFIYMLSMLQYTPQIITKDLILQKITLIDQLTLQTIYQIKTIQKKYDLQLTSVAEERLRKTFIQKRKDFTQEDSQYIVQMLTFYPQSANLLNLSSLTIDSYISYLEFFLQQQEQESQKSIPKPVQHPIPDFVLQNAEIYQLYHIIKHRLSLALQTSQTIALGMKDLYTPNLNCVIAIIRFFQKQDRMTPETQAIIQKSITKKIINHGQKIFDQFKIVEVFKLLGYLSVNELGTINFWKKTLKFVSNAIEDPQNYKNLTSQQQKKFVVYLFQIFKNKPFPRQLQDQIINLTLLSLTINKWTLKQILPLIISLKVNKISDNELWFGIQQRIKKIDLKHLDSHDDRRILRKIVYNFNLMGKGSYEFWSEINKNLSKKQKMQVLNGFKVPSTMAHTYFKI